MPRLRQIRSTGPAKMSLSIFGHPLRGGESKMISSCPAETAADVPVPSCPDGKCSYESPGSDHLEMDLGEDNSVKVPGKEPQQTKEGDGHHQIEGWIPRLVPKSGPKFLSLGKEEREELHRLHVNLGHPDPEKFCRFLVERGAKPAVVEGSKDMCCDTCVETQNKPSWLNLVAFTLILISMMLLVLMGLIGEIVVGRFFILCILLMKPPFFMLEQ